MLTLASSLITTWQAIVLGALQGVTELFPVSSLGHTVLFPKLFGWSNIVAWQSQTESPWLAFIVMLHVGSAVGLLIYFWKDWVLIIKAFFATLRKRRARHADGAPGLVDHRAPASRRGSSASCSSTRRAWPRPSPRSRAIFLMINGLILLGAEWLRRQQEVRALAAREGLNEYGGRKLDTLEYKEAGDDRRRAVGRR